MNIYMYMYPIRAQGSLEFLKWVTTIDNPFIIYNAHTDKESSRFVCACI